MKTKVYITVLFTITLDGEHLAYVIENGLSLSILEKIVFIENVMDINKSEGLSRQILLLGTKAECTGLD